MLPARDGEALDRWLPPGGGDGRRGRPIEAWGKGSETANGRPRVLARRRPSGHIEQKVTLVIAGIDTHKDTLAVGSSTTLAGSSPAATFPTPSLVSSSWSTFRHPPGAAGGDR